jgi:hypothetical protein
VTRRAGRRAGIVAAALLLAACAVDASPSASSAGRPSAAAASASAASESDAPSPSGTRASPGRPYEGDALLAAMRDSRRPGGVPDQLETDAVAAAVAAQLWTWDGEPWEILSVGGACGPDACSLDVAGSTDGTAGTDLYSFAVEPESGAVSLVGTDLHAHPTELEAEMDAAARAALDEAQLEGLALVGARWLPPPETDRYWLAYRSGGEEGAPMLEVLLDLASGEVLRIEDGA